MKQLDKRPRLRWVTLWSILLWGSLLGAMTPARAAFFYVNDSSTNLDIYTSATGTNCLTCGTNPASPMLTLSNLLAQYDLEPNDVVYLDTGTYSNFLVTVTTNDSGSASGYVTFQGSTNGTVLVQTNNVSSVWSISTPGQLGVSYIRLNDLTIRGGQRGVDTILTPYTELRRVNILEQTVQSVLIRGSANSRLENCVLVSSGSGINLVENSTNVQIVSSMIYANLRGVDGVLASGQRNYMSNTIVRVSGSGTAGSYAMAGVVDGNFNLFHLENGAFISSNAPHLIDFQSIRGTEQFSIVADPQFADPANRDFSLRSQFGRWQNGVLVTDLVTSVAIDLGDPSATFTNELTPNGGRINLGRNGNTSLASLSSTNARLVALTLNDSGAVTGTITLSWAAINLHSASTVRVEYSPNEGASWTNIAGGVPATNQQVAWNTTLFASSARGLWRVTMETNAAATDVVDTMFSVRNSNLFFYVNDASTNQDVYCSAPGQVTNNGVEASSPLSSLQDVINRYDVDAGDIIYVDTGLYLLTNTVALTAFDSGRPGRYLRIQGSTNFSAGGSILNRQANNQDVMQVYGGEWIQVADLVLTGGRRGFFGNRSSDLLLQGLMIWSNNGSGLIMGAAGASNAAAHNIRIENCLMFSNGVANAAVEANLSTNIQVRNSTLWMDRGVLLQFSARISVSNSIVRASGSGRACLDVAGGTLDGADFNVYQYVSNAVVFPGYPNLSDYQKVFGQDLRSTVADPQFASIHGNLFEQSVTGRWTPSGFVADGAHSVAIDFGDPTQAVTNETPGNGGRVNAGAFGNTVRASRSRTNAWVYALTHRDGGTLSAGSDSVCWNYGNLAPTQQVRIEYSGNGGASWAPVASNLTAGSDCYTWINTNYPSSVAARWRIVLQADTNVVSATDATNFTFRNGPAPYYVNDSNPTGDIYCTALGDDNFTGTSPETPKASLSNLLANVDLEPGDIVYIDTGVYQAPSMVTLDSRHNGVGTNRVIFQFSTNRLFGGARLGRQSTGGDVFQFNSAAHVEWRDAVIMTNYGIGVRIDTSTGIVLRGLTAGGSVDSSVRVNGAPTTTIARSVFYGNANFGISVLGGGSLAVENSVFWRNRGAGLSVSAGSATVSGSVVVATGLRAHAYRSPTVTNIIGNYNAIYVESNAAVAQVTALPDSIDSLAAWQNLTGQEWNSLGVDPQFADPAALDFHLRTETPEGRYSPALGSWVSDSITSLLIDGGDPARPVGSETPFNGGRVNIGLYGGTVEASRGRATPWLHAASFEQGGWAKGTVTLAWVARNFTGGAPVKLEFSPDGGESWTNLNTNILASAESWSWNTTTFSNTWAGLWRVTALTTNVSDQNAALFAIRNSSLALYVNDGATSNDLYTSGPGAATNWAATAARPYHSLAGALRIYDLEPGDRVYVDSGTYAETNAVSLYRPDSGIAGNPVLFLGPTNGQVARVNRQSTAVGSYGLELRDTRWVALSNLTFAGAHVGVWAQESGPVNLSVAAVENASNGFYLFRTTNAVLSRVVAASNACYGVESFQNISLAVDQSVLWSNSLAALNASEGAVTVSNSVLMTHGAGRYVYLLGATSDLTRANFNNILAVGGAQPVLAGARAYRFLSSVRDELGLELNSLSHEPDFAAPATYDFHLLSTAGRYVPGGAVTSDVRTSLLVDAADPARSFASEPGAQGGRMNLGLHGGSHQASQSPTNARFTALSFNDGGSVRGTNALRWVAYGAATGHLVTLQFTSDNGANWTNIATGLAASSGQFTQWNTTVHGAVPAAYWRVLSENDPAIWDTNDVPFTVNNGAITFYVNDGSTNGDVYTSTTGTNLYDGLTRDTPLPSVGAVLSRYLLAAGDRILVDTGTYPLNSPIAFDANIAGGVTNPIVLQGSTNLAAGGTVFDGPVGGSAITIANRAVGLTLRNFTIRNAQAGIVMDGVTNGAIEDVQVRQASTLGSDAFGFDLNRSSNIVFRRCVAAVITNSGNSGVGRGLRVLNSRSVAWLDGVMWSNATAVEVSASDLNVTNSIFAAFGTSNLVYRLQVGATLRADYNNYWVRQNALVARVLDSYLIDILTPSLVAQRDYESVSQWSRETGRDGFSLSHDPGFVDASAGNFRLLSQGGRPVPGSGAVTDAVSSVLIDAGPPGWTFSGELLPNGRRVNMGNHANTGQASGTATNSRLTVVSFNDGGIASGTNAILYWVASGAATGHLVQIDISYENGLSWFMLASNIPANVSTVRWDTTTWFTQPYVRWRVQSMSDPSVSDMADTWFTIRNSNIVYYVNDSNTVGDIYTVNPGGFGGGNGLTTNTPMEHLDDLLRTYDLEAGDRVYMDTGVYVPTQQLTYIGYADSGAGAGLVNILGSTNSSQGGTRIIGAGLTIEGANGLSLQNLEFEGVVSRPGLVFAAAVSNVQLEAVGARGMVGVGMRALRSRGVIFTRCSVLGATTNGLHDDNSYGTVWQNGLLWSNVNAVQASGREGAGQLAISNSILVGYGSAQTIYRYQDTGAFTSDYNAVFITNGALVARRLLGDQTLQYASVAQWARETGRDQRTLAGDPLFAAPGIDFRLRSAAGRYDPAVTGFVADAATSPLIDAGGPGYPFALETTNNGGRINIGPQGNAYEASRTPTNVALVAVSLNDGGIASGDQVLYWVARGAATGLPLQIDYSSDDGMTWTNVVTGLAPGTTTYTWSTTNYVSSILARWRVLVAGDTNTADVSDTTFAVRNSPIPFYVNDLQTNQDVYCAAPGASTNRGVNPASPMLTIQNVLDRYDLEPGDIIYVDTGIFTNATPTQFRQLDQGTDAARVVVQGSTNETAGGTVILATGGGFVLDFNDTAYFEVRDLHLRAVSAAAVYINKATGLRFVRVTTTDGVYGYQMLASSAIEWRNCLARHHNRSAVNMSAVDQASWDFGVMWSNRSAAVELFGSTMSISNSVVGGLNGGSILYKLDAPSILQANYNAYFITNGALMAEQGVSGSEVSIPRQWENVARWARDTGQDRFSYAGDPGFVDADGLNFHLRTQAPGGRYNPVTGTYTNDATTSPLVDAGSPSVSVTNEPSPNGGRVNIGLYGNSSFASRTPTNPALQVISLNDGGRAEGVQWPLYWVARGVATGHTVRLEYAGTTANVWTVIATGLPARVVSPVFWDTTIQTSSMMGIWRVVSEVTNAIVSSTARRFAVRNQALSFYVNDGNAVGDVYSGGFFGSAENDGLAPNRPKNRIQDIFNLYDLEPGDTVYVDTGDYSMVNETNRWGRFDAWDQTDDLSPLLGGQRSVLLQGSTNYADGGSRLLVFQSGTAMLLDKAYGAAIRDLIIRQSTPNVGTGIELLETRFPSIRRVEVQNGRIGMYLNYATDVSILNSLIRGATFAGLLVVDSSSSSFRSGVLWSNKVGLLQQYSQPYAGQSFTLENSALGAIGEERYGIIKSRFGRLLSDYNAIYRTGGGFSGAVEDGTSFGGGTTRYESVTSWAVGATNDFNTLPVNPAFAGLNDFHLQSPAGRYVPGSGYITNLSDSISKLMDAGRPSSPFAAETPPNGARLNIGMYGNTSESSLSPTNGRLSIITFNDGGSGIGNINLRWVAAGAATSDFVTLQYSANGGGTWSNIAANVPATQGSFDWNSTPFGASAAGLWRIFSQGDSNVLDVTDTFFSLRNRAGGGASVPYYVNDPSLDPSDVYCTNPGNDSNNGFLPATPKASLQALLDSVDLEPGDIVYVDTGIYPISAAVVIRDLDSGVATNPVVIQGSTNLAAGGTVFNRSTSLGTALQLYETRGVHVRDLSLINASIGLDLYKSEDCVVERVRSYNHSGPAFQMQLANASTSNRFLNCMAAFSGEGLSISTSLMDWRNGVIWGNAIPIYLGSGGDLRLYNSVVQAAGSDRRIFNLEVASGNITANYNNYVLNDGALMYERADLVLGQFNLIARLTDWQLASGQDARSMVLDPLFVNPAARDFHEQSAAGRFLSSGALTNDAPGVFSPLIDTGDPASTWTNELPPNGGKINIGMFGNTPQASLSQTNPWLLALNFNDGGVIAGTVTVHWAWGGMTNGTLISLQQAVNGVDFTTFASNLAVETGSYPWNVSGLPLTTFGKWRVICQECGAGDENNSPLTIKNQSLTVYVNDTNQVGDAFCVGPGAVTNSGVSPDSPLLSPEAALQKFDLTAGDVVYIDTGVYSLTNATGLAVGLAGNVFETGTTGQPIRVIGSPDRTNGGTRIIGVPVSTGACMTIRQARYVEVENLALEGSGHGIYLEGAAVISLRDMRIYSNLVNGIYSISTRDIDVLRSEVWANGYYGVAADILPASIVFDQGVLWNNASGAVFAANLGRVSVSNSILQAGVPNANIMYSEGVATLSGDYNMFWPENGARIGLDARRRLVMNSLSAWQNGWNCDSNSAVLNPAVSDPAAGLFYLRSAAGRYDHPNSTNFVADTNTSWAIDAADPARAFSAEVSPNGGRMNLGSHGNTFRASLTVTNTALRALQAVSFIDGGQMAVPMNLRWFARGFATNDLVYLEYSVDDGVNWRLIATNVPATQGSFFWNPDPTNSSPSTRWRVCAQSGPGACSGTPTNFSLRLQPVTYFVNDASTNQDLYCTQPGTNTANGLFPNTPMDSVQALLDRYDLEPGDRVLVDTGYYLITNGLRLVSDDNGSSNLFVNIIGSRNLAGGGTVFDRASTNIGSLVEADPVVDILQMRGIGLSFLTLQGGNSGIAMTRVNDSCISNVVIRDGGLDGIRVVQGSNFTMNRSVISRMAGRGLNLLAANTVNVLNSIIWSNGITPIAGTGSALLTVSNTVLHAFASNRCYALLQQDGFIADYNHYHLEGAARPAIVDGTAVDGMPQWNALTGQDLHTSLGDPLFANAGAFDFHPRSPLGRYVTSVGDFVVTNEAYSPLVDAGSPYAAFTNEPSPNGGRRNVGIFGHTLEASKGRTNAWLRAVTGASGGRAAGAFWLAWLWGNMPATNTVRLEFSYDQGTNWVLITSNQLVSTDQYFWDSELEPLANSPVAKWRLTVEGTNAVTDETDQTFSLNGPFGFYINDNDTLNDVYTFSIGSSNNLGLFPTGPKASLRDVLERWDLDGGDTIYVDTGVYEYSTNDVVFMLDGDAGLPNAPVTVIGPDHPTGATFTWPGPGAPLTLVSLQGSEVEFGRIKFRGSGLNTSGTNIHLFQLEFTNAAAVLGGDETTVSNVVMRRGKLSINGRTQDLTRIQALDSDLGISGTEITLRNSVAYHSGYDTQQVAAAISGKSIKMFNNTVVGRRSAVQVNGADASLTMRNNILVADGSDTEAYVIRVDNGTLVSDYNNLLGRNGAWIGNTDGSWEKLIYWQRASGQDANSISAEPLFANETGADFHLKSVVGRYVTTGFAPDAVHSPAIDLGAPESTFAAEEDPNGGRINLGAYGNTTEASLSRITPWLQVMTVNDGGVLRGTNTLRWMAGGLSGGETVTLVYSPNGGLTWTNIATGLPINQGQGQYTWNTLNMSSSWSALWGVILDSDTNVYDYTDNQFALRNVAQNFYVNDAVTNGDVYAAGSIGLATNDGLTPVTPQLSLSTLLATYDVEGGDVIYVDTGTYASTNSIRIIWSRGGDPTNGPLWIWGSTNFAAGGSIIDRASTNTNSIAFDIPASHVRVRNLTVQSGGRGVYLNSNRFVVVERMLAVSNAIGVEAFKSFRPVIQNNRFWTNSQGGVLLNNSVSNTVQNNTFHGQRLYGVNVNNSVPNILQNNIFSLAAVGSSAYVGLLDGSFIDYNVYHFQAANTFIAGGSTDLLGWQLAFGRDYRSAVTNPLLANVSSGDFHVRSTAGRWQDGVGYTNDAVDSWAIDRGSTNLAFALEPSPNGGRINIGAYGNTEYASKGRLSTQVLVEVRILNQPTLINETNSTWPLIWSAINVPTTELFRVEYSGDNGANWYVLSNNVPAYREFIVWPTSPFFNTYRGRWRIVGVGNTNYVDINDAPFEIFYGQFQISQTLARGTTNGIVFRGAWAENYQVQWTTNLLAPSGGWVNAVNGVGPQEQASFLSTNGGDFTYYDRGSPTNRYRYYRVLHQQY